jgi:hypothetical protein
MNDLITLDHKSCYNPTGRWEASGEWEASPDVIIHLRSYGVAKGPEIVWEHEVEHVEIYNGNQDVASAYLGHGPNFSGIAGIDWTSGYAVGLNPVSTGWMLGVAHAWAKKHASEWADKHKEPIADTPNED